MFTDKSIAKKLLPIGQIVQALFLVLFLCIISNTWKVSAQEISYEKLAAILANQPDYSAERTLNYQGKLRFTVKFTRKHDMAREEYTFPKNYQLIAIVQLSQRRFLLLDPQRKTYYEDSDLDAEHFGETAQVVPIPIIPLDMFVQGSSILLPEKGNCKIENLGNVSLDGHNAMKLKISNKEGISYYYFAKDLKDLLIKVEVESNNVELNYSDTVTGITQNVSEQLFQVPPDYKKVELETIISAMPQDVLQMEFEKRKSLQSN